MKNYVCNTTAVLNASVDVKGLLEIERAANELRIFMDEIMDATIGFFIYTIVLATVFIIICHGRDICDFFSDLDPMGFLFEATSELSPSSKTQKSRSMEKEQEIIYTSEASEEKTEEREDIFPKMGPVKQTIKKKTVICKSCAGVKVKGENCPYCGVG